MIEEKIQNENGPMESNKTEIREITDEECLITDELSSDGRK